MVASGSRSSFKIEHVILFLKNLGVALISVQCLEDTD